MANAGNGVPRTDAWKPPARRSLAASPGRRRTIALILAVTAVTCAATVLGLVLGPLFAWQTAVVTLAVDQYRLGTLAPVPFSEADTAAIEDAIKRAPGAAFGGKAVAVDGTETVDGMRDLLLPKMTSLPLRAKDVLIAYVRGQTIAAVPVFDAEGMPLSDPVTERACLVAADCTIRGARPRELIPIREVVEAIGAATSRTTLVFIDLGDVHWDPRIGTLAHVVPRLLDEELVAAQKKARGDVWVLGSQDIFQISEASLSGGRTYFSRAVEMALSGAADGAGCGDGDGIVELDEVTRFVTRWTSEWVRRASGGRHQQTPVLWKLGAGRVAVDAAPPAVGLVRVGRKVPTVAAAKPAPPAAAPAPVEPAPGAKPAEKPAAKPAASTSGEPRATIIRVAGEAPAMPAAGTPPPAAEAARPNADVVFPANNAVAGTDSTPPSGTGTAAPPGTLPPAAATPGESAATAAPPAAAAPTESGAVPKTAGAAALQAVSPVDQPRPPTRADVWGELARLGKRRATVRRGLGANPTLADLAPHVWAELFSVSAATTAAELVAPEQGGRQSQLDELARALAGVPPPTGRERRADPGNTALSAWMNAEDGGVIRSWTEASPALTAALAVFTDGLFVARSTLDVLGNSTGGANESPMDLGTLATLIEKLAALRAAVAEGDAAGLADESQAEARSLPALTRAVNTQAGLVVDQVNHLIDGLLERGAEGVGDPTYPACIAALRSPALLPARREALLRVLRSERSAADAADARAFATWGGALPPRPEYGRVEQGHLASIAELAGNLITLVGGLGVPRGATAEGSVSAARIVGRLAEVRREAVAVIEPFGSERVAISRIINLGGRIAELFAVLATAAEEPRTGVLDFSDIAAAALRLIDPRDVASLTGVSIVGLPGRAGPGAVDVTLAGMPNEALGAGESVQIRVVIGKTLRPLDDPRIRFVFEPADLDVRILNGGRIDPQRAMPLSQVVGAGGDVTLLVTTQPGAGARAGGIDVPLTVRCESQGRISSAEGRIRVVGDRTIALAVRRLPAQQAGSNASWRFARPVATDETSVVLPGLAGRTVEWEFGLENRSGGPRTVAAELYSVGPTATDSADPWAAFAARIAAGKSLPTPLAAAPAVALGKERGPVALALAPTPAEPLPAPAPAGAAPDDGLKLPGSPQKPVGPDLALVVRETTKGEPARRWLHRLRLALEHPRDVFEATATWVARDRTILVRVAARDPQAAMLDEPVIVSLGALGDDAAMGERFVQVRRGSVTLSQRTPADTLVAEWLGPERDSLAWLAVGVNGYPRAFVFGVSCAPATDGQPQQPQADWRRVRITMPTERLTLVRAPVATFPMELLIDAPPDARTAGRDEPLARSDDAPPLGRLLLREARAGSISGEPGRTAWTTMSDRKIEFMLEKAAPPATLAVSTAVADWRIDVPGTGFVDVDVEAEAGLAMPGVQRPLTATTRFVFDGRPPVVEAPASVNAVVGRRLVIPLNVTDDPRESFATNAGVRLPGVSGVSRVEWAIDAKGDGKPEGWKPASSLEGGRYEITIDTAAFVPAVRLAALVRATDRVGLSAPPTRIWIEVGRTVAKGSIRGVVKLDGRGEAGVTVSADGPGGPPAVRSGADGSFTFPDLEPGEYKISARGVVLNRTRAAAPISVVVPAPPAESPTATLELK